MANSARGINRPLFYDALVFLMTRGREARYRAHLLDLAAVAPGQQVLDVGCGTGTTAVAAWRRIEPGGAVYGIDVAPAMIARARRKAPREALDRAVYFLGGDAVSLPFRDGMFDLALLSTVLHMLPPDERPAAIGEIARVLKPGGRLLVVDYGGTGRKGLVAHHHRHRTFDIASVAPMLEAAGLVRMSAGPTGWLSLSYILAAKS